TPPARRRPGPSAVVGGGARGRSPGGGPSGAGRGPRTLRRHRPGQGGTGPIALLRRALGRRRGRGAGGFPGHRQPLLDLRPRLADRRPRRTTRLIPPGGEARRPETTLPRGDG